jgi:diaminohydroxyphosphoribosylaminopyrimidine deaminase/5-amino-6-(5-phosphoribosylamino)uracil reductase
MTDLDIDQYYMKKALRLAVRGAGRTSPNPLVGAVLVKDGEIVGRGFHEVLGGAHAEVNAITDAGEAAKGSTLYVTLEPCNHQGLTPPCTRAVLAAGISRVVCGMKDPNPDVAGGGCEYLSARGVETISGVLETECRGINQPFIKYVTTGLPYVRLKAAATLDGFIATAAGDSKWITNERSRQAGHKLRYTSDAVLVGIGTVLADDPLLTARLGGRGALRQPVRIVLDTHLQTPPESKLVRSAESSPVWIACSTAAPAERESALSRPGVTIIRTPAADSGLDLAPLLKELGRRRISCILVEGGGRVHGSFMESGFADEFYFFYAPKILGDREAVGMIRGRPRLRIADSVPAFGVQTRNIDGDILVSGRFHKELY